jgi:alcohol dehydrogenase
VPELFKDIAEDMGENTEGHSMMGKAMKAVEAVLKLSQDIQIPTRLSFFNVNKERIPEMAQDAMKSGNILINPRKTSLEDLITLYERAL